MKTKAFINRHFVSVTHISLAVIFIVVIVAMSVQAVNTKHAPTEGKPADTARETDEAQPPTAENDAPAQNQDADRIPSPATSVPGKATTGGYVAPVCTKSVLPHGSRTVQQPYSYTDETRTVRGSDGYLQTCTADSTGWKPADVRKEPVDTVVYQGTRSREADADAAYARWITKCRQQFGDVSSAYQQCVQSY